MPNDVGVSSEKLTETVTTLTETKKTMLNKLGNISSSVNNMNEAWKSDASAKLSAIASTMSERFTELDKQVNSFIVFLNQIIVNYEKNEVTQQDILTKVMGEFK